ncbi:MAG: FRG domain-containing protein [Ferruginibacter sp.]
MFTKRLTKIIEEINDFQNINGNSYFVYRGQSESSWNLRPSLFVKMLQKKLTKQEIVTIENNLYFDFTINAKGILESSQKSWQTLFQMRHIGLPTRILDWTENLNMAIYFSVYGQGTSPCIWVLDAHKLNQIALSNEDIPNPLDPNDEIIDYKEAFLPKNSSVDAPNFYKLPFAMVAPRMSDRIFAQRGLFTVQTSGDKMIDQIAQLKGCVKQIKLLDSDTTIDMVKDYLKIMGINHFTVYPDFEGLRLYLMEEHELD